MSLSPTASTRFDRNGRVAPVEGGRVEERTSLARAVHQALLEESIEGGHHRRVGRRADELRLHFADREWSAAPHGVHHGPFEGAQGNP